MLRYTTGSAGKQFHRVWTLYEFSNVFLKLPDSKRTFDNGNHCVVSLQYDLVLVVMAMTAVIVVMVVTAVTTVTAVMAMMTMMAMTAMTATMVVQLESSDGSVDP